METTDVPSTALAAQRSTWSLGILSVCAFAIRIHDMALLSGPLLLARLFPTATCVPERACLKTYRPVPDRRLSGMVLDHAAGRCVFCQASPNC